MHPAAVGKARPRGPSRREGAEVRHRDPDHTSARTVLPQSMQFRNGIGDMLKNLFEIDHVKGATRKLFEFSDRLSVSVDAVTHAFGNRFIRRDRESDRFKFLAPDPVTAPEIQKFRAPPCPRRSKAVQHFRLAADCRAIRAVRRPPLFASLPLRTRSVHAEQTLLVRLVRVPEMPASGTVPYGQRKRCLPAVHFTAIFAAAELAKLLAASVIRFVYHPCVCLTACRAVRNRAGNDRCCLRVIHSRLHHALSPPSTM